VVGQVLEREEKVSKNKKPYTKFVIKDDTGSIVGMSFSLKSQEAMLQVNGRELKEGDICVWHLNKKVNEADSIIFVEDAVLQDVPTVLKTSTVRKEMEESENKKES
jgi:hypothetical protein